MSRLRVSHAPGGWLDEGPSSVAQSKHIGGQMVVAAPTPGVKNDAWLLRRDKGDPRPPKPRCEEPMTNGRICARLHSHDGYHASRSALDSDNQRKLRKAA